MNLEDLTVTGTNQIYVTDSLNSSLMKLSVRRNTNTTSDETNGLIVYVDKQDASNPTEERKQYVFELGSPLLYSNDVSDEFLLQLKVINNDIRFIATVERKLSLVDDVYTVLEESIIDELAAFPITLFEGENYIYTNYSNAIITITYPKSNEMSRLYLNNAIFGGHRLNASGDFSLEDIYFKDAFTKTGDELNLRVDNVEIKCLSSKNNKFSLDENGNLIVNSIVSNGGIDINNQSICNLIYPIGSIYMSTSAISPSTLFGGVWEQLKDKFLLCAGDTYEAGSTGGSATHTLTVEEMPGHTHGQRWIGSDGNASPYVRNTASGSFETSPGVYYMNQSAYYNSSNKKQLVNTFGKGGNQAHNNMPPYLTVYMWKRTA